MALISAGQLLALSGVLWAIKLHAEAHPKDAPPEMH